MEMKQKWKERRRKHECNRSNQKQKKYPEVSAGRPDSPGGPGPDTGAAMMAPAHVIQDPGSSWWWKTGRSWKNSGISSYTGMMKTASLAILVCGRPELQEGGNEFWPQELWSAIENILLQALELGYGTCWCGFYPVEDRVKASRNCLGWKVSRWEQWPWALQRKLRRPGDIMIRAG